MILTKKHLEFITSLSDNQDECDKLTGEVIRACYNHFYLDIDTNLSKIAKVAFKYIKIDLDEQLTQKEKIRDRNRLNGAKGGRPKKQTNKPAVKKVEIPEFEEFKKYVDSKSQNVSNELLKLKYDSWKENGWKDGKHKPIKNWKTKILNTIPYLKNEKVRKQATYDSKRESEIAETLFGDFS